MVCKPPRNLLPSSRLISGSDRRAQSILIPFHLEIAMDSLSNGQETGEPPNHVKKNGKKRAQVVLEPEVVESDEVDDVEDEDNVREEDQDLLEDLPDDTAVRTSSTNSPSCSSFWLTNGSRDAAQEIELIHSRLQSLQNLRLPRFGPNLHKLCLRQNHISNLDPSIFGHLTELEELDLYDNKIKHVDDGLDECKKMR